MDESFYTKVVEYGVPYLQAREQFNALVMPEPVSLPIAVPDIAAYDSYIASLEAYKIASETYRVNYTNLLNTMITLETRIVEIIPLQMVWFKIDTFAIARYHDTTSKRDRLVFRSWIDNIESVADYLFNIVANPTIIEEGAL